MPVVLAGVALVVGGLLRSWLLTHLPLFSDEAVVGLMARGVTQGHLGAFYWGQTYGGVEPYAVAGLFGLAGAGPLTLNLTPALLAALAGALVSATTWRLTRSGPVALAAGALVWIWPYAALWNSVREIGFRGVALACGLTLCWCALARGRPGRDLLLGLAAGVGWWASPEILYFVVPAVLLLVLGSRRGGPEQPPRRFPLVAVGAVVGALPWLWATVTRGGTTLRPPAVVVLPGQGYLGRLGDFFTHVLPLQLGLRRLLAPTPWLGGPVVGVTLYVVTLVVLVVLLVGAGRDLRRGGPGVAAALGAGVVAFPFLLAAFPTSYYWADGRYGVFLPPLLVLLAVAVTAAPRPAPAHGRSARRGTPATAAALILAGATVLTLAGASAADVPVAHPARALAAPRDPDGPARAVDRDLVRHGLTSAWASYWVAYPLDFLDPGAVAVSPRPGDHARDARLLARVDRDPRAAWLFPAPGRAAEAAGVFSNPDTGAGGLDQAAFTARLRALGIGYRVVPLGLMVAVVPDRQPAPA